MATAAKGKQAPSENGVTSLEEWKKARRIHATIPTGAKVVVEAKTLDELGAINAVPEDLIHVAQLHASGMFELTIVELLRSKDPKAEGEIEELSKQSLALRNRIVLAALVEPVIEESDLADLDPYDLDMIAGIAQRTVEFDAAGRRVYGAQPDTFPAPGEEQ